MFQIRSAKTEDRESIQRIYVAVVGPEANQDEEQWDDLIRGGGLLIAQAENRIVGFGGIDVKAKEHVKWLYLLRQFQGAGLGWEILRRLEDIGWEAGLNSLRLHSAPEAVEFYRRHGYRNVEAAEQVAHDHAGIEMVKDRPARDDGR